MTVGVVVDQYLDNQVRPVIRWGTHPVTYYSAYSDHDKDTFSQKKKKLLLLKNESRYPVAHTQPGFTHLLSLGFRTQSTGKTCLPGQQLEGRNLLGVCVIVKIFSREHKHSVPVTVCTS